MPTSELSNALNPYVNQERHIQQVSEYPVPPHQVVPTHQQQYVPHRSELELAIFEPQPPPQPVVSNRPPSFRPRGQLSQEGVNPLQELFRLVATTRDAQEIERKRRLAWEQGQEAKFAQRQAETERSILEMRQEIQSLRALVSRQAKAPCSSGQQPPLQAPQLASGQPVPQPPATSTNGLFTPHDSMSPAVQEQTVPQHPATPTMPRSVGQSQAIAQHTFVQGNSNETYPPYSQPSPVEPSLRHVAQQHSPYPPHVAQVQPRQPQPQHPYQVGLRHQQLHGQHLAPLQSETARHPVAQSVTPSPSPQLSVSQPQTDSSLNRKKRKTSEVSSDGGSDADSNDSDAAPIPRMKRISHHDRRCRTVQHAMRQHFKRCMDLETDRQLPNSHVEGVSFDDSQPVRFVWDKTTKQSVHNARMKARILADIKAKRSLYKHVPEKDFSKKVLDAAFEQCFVTFRQKFKAQHDAAAAMNLRQREDQKSRRARHLSRRKTKLSNRADARQKLPVFEHVTFDGALQLECMSSEESEEEDEPVSSPAMSSVLCTRGYAWRSARLIRFYCRLDDEDRSDKSTKPKRGVGKRERRVGPPKEGFHLPPKGVATWMISRRWLDTAQRERPDLPEMLSKLVYDPPGFDWDQFNTLGLESDAEDGRNERDTRQDEVPNVHMQQLIQMGQSHFPSTSSLNYALV